MTPAKARNLIAQMDSEIENLMSEHYGLECDIEELLLKRYRFIRRYAKLFAPKELTTLKDTWKNDSPAAEN